MSITIWNRIEPRTREGAKVRAPDDPAPDPLRRGLQGQVRDPAWFIARQFQFGEFWGEDAGSKVQATIRVEMHQLTGATLPLGGTRSALVGEAPLEVRVEQTPVRLGLRGAVQLGLRFEELLRALPLAAAERDARLGDFRQAYGVTAATPADEIADQSAARLRRIAAGRVTDGVALYDDASATLPAVPAALQAVLSAQQWQSVRPAVEAFVAYRRSLYSEPPAGTSAAWDPRELRHHFAVDIAGLNLSLEASEYEGGHLDWYDVRARAITPPAAGAQPMTMDRTFIPQPIGFRGMASSRWWELDDRRTDFGGLDVQHTDLARMLLAEFALIYSEDWYELPVRAPVGAVAHIRFIVVDDTFGERTLIRSTYEQVAAGQVPWSLFAISGGAAPKGSLFLPPALGSVLDSRAIEEVTFFRDEVAAMGWAVERTLQGPMDAPVDGYEGYLERLRAAPPPPPPLRAPGGPEIEYVLGTSVPDNWIPLVPVTGPTGGGLAPRSFLFRRGLMQRPAASGGLEDVPARGQLLEPWRKPFYVVEEGVPRSGARVSRRFRRARWSDGRTYVWVGRLAGVGRGEGASGLVFDAIRQLREP
jgi:hypothetical protein